MTASHAASVRVHLVAPTALWHRRHLIVSAALWVLATALLEWSWYGASKQDNLDDMAPWALVGGLAALAAGLGGIVLLARALRSVRARQQGICRDIDRIADLITEQFAVDDPAARAALNGAAGELRHLPGTTLFHRDDCLLIRGKGAAYASRSALEGAGHGPCGVCKP